MSNPKTFTQLETAYTSLEILAWPALATGSTKKIQDASCALINRLLWNQAWCSWGRRQKIFESRDASTFWLRSFQGYTQKGILSSKWHDLQFHVNLSYMIDFRVVGWHVCYGSVHVWARFFISTASRRRSISCTERWRRDEFGQYLTTIPGSAGIF